MTKIIVNSIAQEVTQQVREMIRTGALEEGSRISEKELGEAMGVSRTPVREALRVLAAEGLVQLIPRKGAFVTKPRFEDVRDMFEVMSLLEGLCARVAAEKMSTSAFSQLENLHQELEEHYQRRDRESYLQCNHRYHSYVQEIAGNRILNEVLDSLRQKFLLYRFRQLSQPERFDQSMQEHRALLEAFRQRDSEKAQSLMRHHLMQQCEALVNLYETADGKQALTQ